MSMVAREGRLPDLRYMEYEHDFSGATTGK
jgi:hypothetical protein